MAATTLARRAAEPPVLARLKTDPAFQAFWMMRIGFTVVPILFGADKFAHVMVNWDKYLAPCCCRASAATWWGCGWRASSRTWR